MTLRLIEIHLLLGDIPNDVEAKAGLKYLREAVSRDCNPLIRYHLVAALYNLGRNNEALTEFENILHPSNKPPWIDSARKLYEMIKQSG